MAWPFSSSNAPNLDTGPGQDVPVGATSITTDPAWLLGAHFKNTALVSRTITVTDTVGKILCLVKLPAGAEQPYEWPFRPVVGVKWSADGIDVKGHIWGYQ